LRKKLHFEELGNATISDITDPVLSSFLVSMLLSRLYVSE